MPYVETVLNLSRTGVNDKWENYSTSVALPAQAQYTHTDAIYSCPAHGPEHVGEGTQGHWFRFNAATWDREKGVVRCDCSYQVHDRDTQVVFRVNYRE